MVIALAGNNNLMQGLAEMIVLEFYFLLQPSKSTDSASETTLFKLVDAQLFIGGTHINLITASKC